LKIQISVPVQRRNIKRYQRLLPRRRRKKVEKEEILEEIKEVGKCGRVNEVRYNEIHELVICFKWQCNTSCVRFPDIQVLYRLFRSVQMSR